MIIRFAQPSDAAPILRITEDAWIEKYVNAVDGIADSDVRKLSITGAANLQKQEAALARASSRRFVLTAEDAGVVVGYILFVKRPDSGWYLKSIYVQSSHRSRGVGSRLLDEAIKYLKARWVEGQPQSISLDVAKSNDAAIGFYKKRGWFEVGTSVFMIGAHSLPTVTMRLNIADHDI